MQDSKDKWRAEQKAITTKVRRWVGKVVCGCHMGPCKRCETLMDNVKWSMGTCCCRTLQIIKPEYVPHVLLWRIFRNVWCSSALWWVSKWRLRTTLLEITRKSGTESWAVRMDSCSFSMSGINDHSLWSHFPTLFRSSYHLHLMGIYTAV